MAAALQIASHSYSKSFDALPATVQEAVQKKLDDLGARLGHFPYKRLTGRNECKLRVGDYRLLYEFDQSLGRLYLHYVGHRREIYK